MEGRICVRTIIKSIDPEKVEVFRSRSFQNEIRFYFNKSQFVSAKEHDNGDVTVQLGEHETECDAEENSTLRNIKESIRNLLNSFFIGALCLPAMIDNAIIYLLLLFTLVFLFRILLRVILEYKNIPTSLKSKHSAEHMMINFLEKNKRLPISVVEVRQTTRFCGFCGSRKKVKGITETFVQEIMTAILIVIINFVIVQKCKNVNQTLLLFDMLLLCSGIAYINGVLIKKCDFIIKPLLNLLDIVIQCSNTTKNVERKDIILAYFAAKYWMKAVYPEFYVEDDSICETD